MTKYSETKAGFIIFGPGGTILVVHQTPGTGMGTGKWGIPKGTQNPGETTFHCAVREVREEVGLVINVEPKFDKIIIDGITFYICKLTEPCIPTIRDENEIAEVRWVTLQELKKLNNRNRSLNFIQKRYGGIMRRAVMATARELTPFDKMRIFTNLDVGVRRTIKYFEIRNSLPARLNTWELSKILLED
ncbi:NUDIX hydrolase, partial [Candidatus Saccharibacteria bacterium]|nr:NUDIX hydrolase [Candidatus Saccharibacteria bacterium]